LPELPGVCLKCGAFGSLIPTRFEFRYTTAAATLLTFMSPLLGALYSRGMSYRPELPVCGDCKAHLKRATRVTVVSVLLALPMLVLTGILLQYDLYFLLTPLVYLVAAYCYHGVVQRRGTPKVARVDKNQLVLDVPGYGALVLFEREPKAGRQPRRQAAPAAGPKLNRSVCDGCGFINFPNVLECKKCQAPLGRVAAFQAAATRG
ncbi:MAG TPA: hypothetical protein VF521_00640, partial [Pyrinomonadaceae bacterium]